MSVIITKASYNLVLVIISNKINVFFPDGSVGKESACSSGDLSLIPELGRSPREGNGNPLQYSYLENPMDRGTWQATVRRITRVGHDLATKPPPLFIFSRIQVSVNVSMNIL